MACETVAILRHYAGRHPDDPELAALVGDLSVRSEAFARWWASLDVRKKTNGVKAFRHPAVGELTLSYETLVLPGDPDQQLVTYTAEPGGPSETALRLLAAWVEPSSSAARARPATEAL